MARLFSKKQQKETTRGVSAVLNPEQIRNNSEPTTRAELDRIIKTTDAMNIALSSDLLKTKETLAPREQTELNSIREAIARSYDLARRKITTQYEQVILSNNYVDNPFLAVQVTIKNIDRNWEVQNVERIIRKFTDAVVEQVALGKTVYLNDELIIEPLTYVDKILPTWKITPKFAILTNSIKWDQVVNELGQDGEVSLADAKEIVSEAIDAMATDVKNGYLVKIGRFVVMQLQVNSPQRVILFSNDTLERINEIHERFIKTGEQKEIRKYDALVHFDKTLENVERGFYSEDIKTPTLRPDFVPRDLTQEINVGRSKSKSKAKDLPLKDDVKAAGAVATTEVATKLATDSKVKGRSKGSKSAKNSKTVLREVAPSSSATAAKPKSTNDRKRRVGKKASKPLAAVGASSVVSQATAEDSTKLKVGAVSKTVASPKVTSVPTPALPKTLNATNTNLTRTATRKLPSSPSATMKVQAVKPSSGVNVALAPKSTAAVGKSTPVVGGLEAIVPPATTEVVTTTTTTKVITTTPGTPASTPAAKSRVIKPKQKVGSFTYTNVVDTAAHQVPSASSVKPVKPAKKRK